MPPHFLDRLTPRAYPRTRFFSAAIVWSCVGAFLCAKGMYLSLGASNTVILGAILAGICLGLVKSRIIFDRVAGKIIEHIGSRPSRACLGGLFSVRNWALILVMAVFGRTLGALPVHAGLKTGLYVMVGSGLGYSSRLLWKAWWNSPAGALQNL
jgi:hypothetical protein